jgi:hypothetical protein
MVNTVKSVAVGDKNIFGLTCTLPFFGHSDFAWLYPVNIKICSVKQKLKM